MLGALYGNRYLGGYRDNKGDLKDFTIIPNYSQAPDKPEQKTPGPLIMLPNEGAFSQTSGIFRDPSKPLPPLVQRSTAAQSTTSQLASTVPSPADYSFRTLDTPREVIPCEDRFFTSVTTPRAYPGIFSESIKDVEIYLSEPFFKSFKTRINGKYLLMDLLPIVRKYMDSLVYSDEYILEDMRFSYAGTECEMTKQIGETLNIPGMNRLDAIFTWSKRLKSVAEANEPKILGASLEAIPVSSSRKYKLGVSFAELSRLSNEQISQLKGFRIGNEHGEITFEESFNAFGLDVDQLVSIEPLNITILNADMLAERYGFNKQIKFLTRNFGLTKGLTEQQIRTKVLKKLHSISAELVTLDIEAGILIYSINSNFIY